MNVEDIILSDRIQVQKDRCHLISQVKSQIVKLSNAEAEWLLWEAGEVRPHSPFRDPKAQL
jgi:hypothetical protein